MGEFSPPPPFFSEPPSNYSSEINHADAQTSNTTTRFWFYYIITKIHPPFQNPGSVPDFIHVGILSYHRGAEIDYLKRFLYNAILPKESKEL